MLAALCLLGINAYAQAEQRPMRERGGPGMQRMLQDARPTQFVPDEEMRRRQHMTPEERRQLRRDVHEAGRELYPPRMRERRREFRREE